MAHRCEVPDCVDPLVHGERYCRAHRWKKVKEMIHAGYLRPVPKVPWSDKQSIVEEGEPIQVLEEMGRVQRIF
jgi:hypothetical protein